MKEPNSENVDPANADVAENSDANAEPPVMTPAARRQQRWIWGIMATFIALNVALLLWRWFGR